MVAPQARSGAAMSAVRSAGTGLLGVLRRTPPEDWLAGAGAAALWCAVVGAAAAGPIWYPRDLDPYWVAGLWLAPALWFRRSAPTAVLLVVAVGMPWTYRVQLVNELHLLPLLLAAAFAAFAGRWPAALTGIVATLSAVVMSLGLQRTVHFEEVYRVLQWTPSRLSGIFDVSATVTRVALVVAATAIGAILGRLAATRRELQQRNRQLLAMQEVRARAAVRAERATIARELHDVVAHHVTAIVVRAQAADLVADEHPDEPREALRWIAGSGRQALDAMRSVVRVLRTEERDASSAMALRGSELPPPRTGPVDDAGAPSEEPYAPVGGLETLPAVVARVCAAGLQVDAELPDPMPVLPPAVQLAVLRVATEALTNVLLHSAAARARLGLQVGAGRLRLQVVDDGPVSPDPEPGGGHGLANMRERASVVGGALSAGPHGAGWAVELVVPVTVAAGESPAPVAPVVDPARPAGQPGVRR